MHRYLYTTLLAASIFCLSSTAEYRQELIVEAEESVNCSKIEEIHETIELAIAVGAPTYNMGNHIGCYFIYEGAAYKIIHLYGSKCKEAKKILETALATCKEESTVSEKAWVMRMAFDNILGVKTEIGTPKTNDGTRGS